MTRRIYLSCRKGVVIEKLGKASAWRKAWFAWCFAQCLADHASACHPCHRGEKIVGGKKKENVPGWQAPYLLRVCRVTGEMQ